MFHMCLLEGWVHLLCESNYCDRVYYSHNHYWVWNCQDFFFFLFFLFMFVKPCIGETGHIEGMLVWKWVLLKANAVKMNPTPICLLLLCYFYVLYTWVFKVGFQGHSDRVPHRALTKRRIIYSDNNSNYE